jgi:hypothetical protein
MLRRLFAGSSALSLLLCGATCALWIRSYWVRDDLSRDAYGSKSGFVFHRAQLLSSGRGELALAYRGYTNSDPAVVNAMPSASGTAATDWHTYPAQDTVGGPLLPNNLTLSRSGFAILVERRRASGYYGERGFAVRLPHWSLFVATAVLPTLLLLHHWRDIRQKSRIGLCARCGYDLRATPDRCPECGRVPTKATISN